MTTNVTNVGLQSLSRRFAVHYGGGDLSVDAVLRRDNGNAVQDLGDDLQTVVHRRYVMEANRARESNEQVPMRTTLGIACSVFQNHNMANNTQGSTEDANLDENFFMEALTQDYIRGAKSLAARMYKYDLMELAKCAEIMKVTHITMDMLHVDDYVVLYRLGLFTRRGQLHFENHVFGLEAVSLAWDRYRRTMGMNRIKEPTLTPAQRTLLFTPQPPPPPPSVQHKPKKRILRRQNNMLLPSKRPQPPPPLPTKKPNTGQHQ